MMNRLIKILAAGVVLISVQAFAQFNASVQGDVQDSSGAVIANAAVKLVNTDTQVTQSATSDASGVYRFLSLAPGHYEVSASAPGFQTTEVPFAADGTEQTGGADPGGGRSDLECIGDGAGAPA